MKQTHSLQHQHHRRESARNASSSFAEPTRLFASVPSTPLFPHEGQQQPAQVAQFKHSFDRLSIHPPIPDGGAGHEEEQSGEQTDMQQAEQQLSSVQRKETKKQPTPQTGEPLQRATDTGRTENHTGMPDNLKAGVESLSGLPMDDVRVHYNSAKPAQVDALAYTQGTEIHVGPGQEQHLGHEAWHVAQQKQGRVESTLQMKGVAINDDPGLEKEADVMGAKALQIPDGGAGHEVEQSGERSDMQQTEEQPSSVQRKETQKQPTPVQRKVSQVEAVIQRTPIGVQDAASIKRELNRLAAAGNQEARRLVRMIDRNTHDYDVKEWLNDAATVTGNSTFQEIADTITVVHGRPQLRVQTGPSCWLYVLEYMAKVADLSIGSLSLAMLAYPDSDDALARLVLLKEEVQGIDVDKRLAAVKLMPERLESFVERLRNYRGASIDQTRLEELARRDFGSSQSSLMINQYYNVNNFNVGDTIVTSAVRADFETVRDRADRLYNIILQETRARRGPGRYTDEIGALLGGSGYTEVRSIDDNNDVLTTLQTAVKLPAYASISKRFKLRGSSNGDFRQKPITEMEDTNHAIVIVGIQGNDVLYKDPNYGDINLKITVRQFKHMAGNRAIKLRTLIKQPLGPDLPKSRITELVD